MPTTNENLQSAFAGESQANRKYLAFAAQAEKDGHHQVAKLFRAVAEAETVHAHSHLKAMGGIKTTQENLKEALSGENYEFQTMYPEMIQKAQDEGNAKAERTFRYANEVEQVHARLYQQAIDNLGSLEETDYFVCSVCGYTCKAETPDKCPVCGAIPKAFFSVT
ncbi:MAG TPA: rubrerythrin family protein [Desulfohalobiaceae bacterium]|nr:rubrerythrin family protein [Desulfohalobiaceae bacterium]